MQRFIATSLLCLASLLGGCGFALRGTASLPDALQTLYLESLDPGSDVEREMRRALQNNRITLLDNPLADTWRLGLGTEENTERALSVNANARAGEYELTMSLPFQLRQGSAIHLGPETLVTSKVYLADPENAVAKNEEAQQIRREMRRELAQQIIRRLQAVTL
jgi:LPS-assembly lipoprotein